MKNSIAQGDQLNNTAWVRFCLHLLAAILLILTPLLLARAQKPSEGTQQPAANSQAPAPQAGESQNKAEGNVTDQLSEREGVLSLVFSRTGVAVILALAIVSFFVALKFRSKSAVANTDDGKLPEQKLKGLDSPKLDPGAAELKELAKLRELAKISRAVSGTSNSRTRKNSVRLPANATSSLFGAYRIDQEVCKLALGQPHRTDVLSSRHSEDRRAIQGSLLKTLMSADCSEDERRRAKEALEEYGFVARESAALLLAADAFERTSAARTLGEIGSATALPFLLEALYDSEAIVRNQAVVSIGELKVPSAIGALLDLAHKHPDVPSSLVSRALSACSVEGLGYFDSPFPATSFPTVGTETPAYDFVLEVRSAAEELPDTLEDEGLTTALNQVFGQNQEEKDQAITNLAQYPAKNAVVALVAVAQQDPEPNNRVLAVSSLASIDHESVFRAVLTGMADESREVRAASARAFSRLSFDRADAYVSLIQTSDFETLHNLAQACIKAGIISQNLDRLASNDRRQAYEAFTLISLLAKAKMTDPIVDAIKNHANRNVRLSAVHLLAYTGEEHVFEQLQQLAQHDDMEEEVKTALLQAMYKLGQSRQKEVTPAPEFVIQDSGNEFETQKDIHESSVGFDLATTETAVDEVGK